MKRVEIKRGDVVDVDLRGAEGAEKQGTRPCVVVQNDGGNRGSPMTIVVPLTDVRQFKGYAQQIQVSAAELGPGGKDSIAECGHVRTIDRDARIVSEQIRTTLESSVMSRIDTGLRASLGLK
ncbi:MAG: type II toxin-antitoxin system PemK/MazF family toxin [Phycisphaerales bacterium JB054]